MNFREFRPDRLRTGFTIALASEETTEACDEAQHLVELGLRWDMSFREQVGVANVITVVKGSPLQPGALSTTLMTPRQVSAR
jgi:hypothetical protein